MCGRLGESVGDEEQRKRRAGREVQGSQRRARGRRSGRRSVGYRPKCTRLAGGVKLGLVVRKLRSVRQGGRAAIWRNCN